MLAVLVLHMQNSHTVVICCSRGTLIIRDMQAGEVITAFIEAKR